MPAHPLAEQLGGLEGGLRSQDRSGRDGRAVGGNHVQVQTHLVGRLVAVLNPDPEVPVATGQANHLDRRPASGIRMHAAEFLLLGLGIAGHCAPGDGQLLAGILGIIHLDNNAQAQLLLDLERVGIGIDDGRSQHDLRRIVGGRDDPALIPTAEAEQQDRQHSGSDRLEQAHAHRLAPWPVPRPKILPGSGPATTGPETPRSLPTYSAKAGSARTRALSRPRRR